MPRSKELPNALKMMEKATKSIKTIWTGHFQHATDYL